MISRKKNYHLDQGNICCNIMLMGLKSNLYAYFNLKTQGWFGFVSELLSIRGDSLGLINIECNSL